MKHPFPVRIPVGWKVIITQGYHANHNGLDVATGDAVMTYGIPVVWPFPFPGKPYEIQVDNPVPALSKRARVQVDGTDPTTGITYSVIGLHASSSPYTVFPSATTDVVFNQGDTIAYIGNSGAVYPKPTPQKGFDGSHLHLSLGVKKPGELNYTMVDPALYFDENNPFRGPDDPSRDQPIYNWMASAAILPSDKLRILADGMQAVNPKQASILRAVAGFLRAFGS